MSQNKKVLVTGGLGFIGSHTVCLLVKQGYTPVIVDNLHNSFKTTLNSLNELTGKELTFYEGDCSDKNLLHNIANKEGSIESCIHFAAHKAVGESTEKPVMYYRNNLGSLLSLLEMADELGLKNFVFSSSCTVYGQPDSLPVAEDAPIKNAESPYGYTKQVCERILTDFAKTSGRLNITLLRYFNPIGAHPSAKIGEWPIGTPNNLVPFITQSAIGKRGALKVFGSDYDTPDGTCIRDYIHVMDLADAHILAMAHNNAHNPEIFNVGTGTGSTVLEVIKAFESSTGEKLNYEMSARREGDVEKVFADPQKIKSELGWEPKYNLADAMKHAWEWEKRLKND